MRVMDPETQWMLSGDLYKYPHMHMSGFLVYDQLGAFYTHPSILRPLLAIFHEKEEDMLCLFL